MNDTNLRYTGAKDAFVVEAVGFLGSTFHTAEEKDTIAHFMYDELQRMEKPGDFRFTEALAYYREGAMQTVADIKKAIEGIITHAKADKDWDDNEREWEVIQAAQRVCGFDYESDEDLMDYALKATTLETWEYWLEHVIPKLKKI